MIYFPETKYILVTDALNTQDTLYFGERLLSNTLLEEGGMCTMNLTPYSHWGMRHTSTALYFYGAPKKSLHKPRATFGNMLFHISYGFNYYLQLLCLQFLSKTHLHL